MVAKDMGTQATDLARERYEDARLRLTDEFGERVRALVGVPEQSLALPVASYEQRAAVIEYGLELIVPLRRFVEQEVSRWIDPAQLHNNVLEIDDVVADTYLAAVDQAETAPVARAFYTWLRRIARRQVRAAVLEFHERQRVEQSLNVTVRTPLAELDEEQHEELLQLIEVLADPKAVLPEDLVERREVQDALAQFLVKLPEQWREVFLMKAVDGWHPDDIAAYEGLDPQQVTWQVAMSREFLRSWIDEARANGEPVAE